MQHLVVYFEHDIRDILPWSDAVKQIRQLLDANGAGEYVEDDLAIDGGDAEVILQGQSADDVYNTIAPVLSDLPFVRGGHVTLIYGPMDSGSRETTIEL